MSALSPNETLIHGGPRTVPGNVTMRATASIPGAAVFFLLVSFLIAGCGHKTNTSEGVPPRSAVLSPTPSSPAKPSARSAGTDPGITAVPVAAPTPPKVQLGDAPRLPKRSAP